MDSLYKDMPILEPRPFSWEASRLVPIDECGEPLVPASLVPEKILTRPQYFIHRIEGAAAECFVRKTVLARLLEAASLLPPGCRFVLLDAWRPKQVQTALFQKFRFELREKMPLLDDQEITALATQFVSPPSIHPASPSPHVTGGAVDLTLAGETGLCLPMGTVFDETTERSVTNYFERKLASKERLDGDEMEFLRNRRILYGVMTRAGFTNYPEEWWHYEYGNQNWALLKGERAAVYGVAQPDFRWTHSM